MHWLVIGVGNPYRSDDAAGLEVAQRLRGQVPAGVEVIEATGEGAALLEAFARSGSVILVDAVRSGAAPGILHRLDALAAPLPASYSFVSSHLFGPAQAIETARALGSLPGRLIVFGLEGESFDYGERLSPSVERAVATAVARILAELAGG